MSQASGDVLTQLEAALQRWTDEMGSSQTSIARHLVAVRERIQAVADQAAQAGGPDGGWDDAFKGVSDMVERLLEEWRRMSAEWSQWRPGVEQAVMGLREELGSVMAQAGRIAELEERVETLIKAVRLQHQALERLSLQSHGGQAESSEPIQGEASFQMDGDASKDAFGVLEHGEAGGRRPRLGEILLAEQDVTDEQLGEALAVQEQDPYRRIGAILVDQGIATEETVARALARQLIMRFIDLDRVEPDPEAVRVISERLAHHHGCIPVSVTGDEVLLAMANPLDLIAIEDVELASGRRVEPAVATATAIRRAIVRSFGLR
ncbi:MAG TPA: hypothetical protein PLO62_11890 [Candidatus Hydrogenedentes bacterium]|nr:hypothetical protein [Candidatus Hydrogenedentota bacterium]HOS03371.1 hypothetical protein [Candidatus Hydrogenedentota bacterium]